MGVGGMQVYCKHLLSLQLWTELKTRHNRKCWLKLAKRKMKSRMKDFPGDMGKSLSMCRAGACCWSSEAIREAAELGMRGLPVCKRNRWLTYQITRLRRRKESQRPLSPFWKIPVAGCQNCPGGWEAAGGELEPSESLPTCHPELESRDAGSATALSLSPLNKMGIL